MADDADLAEAERIEQRQHIGGMLVGAERPVRLVAVAEAAQVRREQGEAIGKARHHRLPQVSENSGQPCSSSGVPAPVRATWNAAPLALTVKCSIVIAPVLVTGPRN